MLCSYSNFLVFYLELFPACILILILVNSIEIMIRIMKDYILFEQYFLTANNYWWWNTFNWNPPSHTSWYMVHLQICRWFPQKVFSLTPLKPLSYIPFGLGMVWFFYSWVTSRILHKKIVGGCPKSCLNSRVFWSNI